MLVFLLLQPLALVIGLAIALPIVARTELGSAAGGIVGVGLELVIGAVTLLYARWKYGVTR